MSSQQAGQSIIEDQDLEKRLADYLVSHPDFLIRNPELLARIHVPHLVGHGAVSLIEHQVRVLRKQLESEQGRLSHLISRARESEALSERLHGLTLHLISISDPDQLCDLLREAMLREFRAEAVTLKLFSLHQSTDGEENPLNNAFGELVNKQHTLCGPLNEAKAVLLFGETGSEIRTAALVPIHAESKSGVLAIGSTDPKRFAADMGTDFLDRLGEIVSHKLRAITLEHRLQN